MTKPTQVFWLTLAIFLSPLLHADEQEPMRIFIFAGQSNMEGADSKVEDIQNFPPYRGLEHPQTDVLFSYCIGRDNKTRSIGWEPLQPVKNLVGPELSFARRIKQEIKAPIGIIKCAAGGTHLGGDWNPDNPEGFEMYPLTMALIKDSLTKLDEQGIKYRIEGVMWHQGENDMFNEDYMANYGFNLSRFLARWRQDLAAPELRFYIGELCTKTIWGMDLRPRMYAISLGQRAVTDRDPFADYVRTSHVGVEIGSGVGLHYHYGTLGQLEHGENYAEAYLRNIGISPKASPPITPWPYSEAGNIKLFVLAGHRNMEGERAFTQDLENEKHPLAQANHSIAYKYSLGGGVKTSNDWEALRPAGFYKTFGPELSFAQTITNGSDDRIAIAKFTHSGSQMNDWTPKGTKALSRHLYPQFVQFVENAIQELQQKGHRVDLEGIFYHVGENEMSMPPYRRQASQWLEATIKQSRIDLKRPNLPWYVSQQVPTDHERVNNIDVTSEIEKLADSDKNLVVINAFELPPQEKKLVLNTLGIIRLGEILGETYLNKQTGN